jgi:hypothetical protein
MHRVISCLFTVVLITALLSVRSTLAQEIPNFVREHRYGDVSGIYGNPGQFLIVGGNCGLDSLGDLHPGDLILLWAINVPGQAPFNNGSTNGLVELVPPITDSKGYVAHLISFVCSAWRAGQ